LVYQLFDRRVFGIGETVSHLDGSNAIGFTFILRPFDVEGACYTSNMVQFDSDFRRERCRRSGVCVVWFDEDTEFTFFIITYINITPEKFNKNVTNVRKLWWNLNL
jgi:hypothetical protein